jgi:hypothetical protein
MHAHIHTCIHNAYIRYIHAYIQIVHRVASQEERQLTWPFVHSYGTILLNAAELANRHETSIDKPRQHFVISTINAYSAGDIYLHVQKLRSHILALP